MEASTTTLLYREHYKEIKDETSKYVLVGILGKVKPA